MKNHEPSADPRQVIGAVGDDLVVLAETVQALYVFSKGHEGPIEETNGLYFLACEINGHVQSIQAQIEKATGPNQALKAVGGTSGD